MAGAFLVEEWQRRRLDNPETVYLWVDGFYMEAGVKKEKAAFLVVVVALTEGSKAVLPVVLGHRESAATWASFPIISCQEF